MRTEQIYIYGTVRSNHQGIPREIGPPVQRVKCLCQGESLFGQKGIVVSVWKDKKPVYFLSTQGDEKDTRKQWDGTNIEEPSVPVVNSYNTNMSGMDLSDQIWGSY